MSIKNQIILTGNIRSTPTIHRKEDGSTGVVSFTLAENISKLNPQTGKYENTHTNWFPIKVFGGLGARVRSALKKGDRVTVCGKLRTYRYKNAEDVNVMAFEVLADEVCNMGILARAAADPRGQKDPEVANE